MDKKILISMESICPCVRNTGRGPIEWQGRMRKIYDCELMYFTEGSGSFTLREEKYPVRPGCLLFIKPNTPHTLVMKNGFKYMWVHFDFVYRDDIGKLREHMIKNYYYGKSYLKPGNELFQDSLPHKEWIRAQPVFDRNFLFPEYIVLREHEVIESLFSKLIFEDAAKKTAYQIKCKALLLNMFAEVMRQLMEMNGIETSYSNYKAFYSLITYIEQNYFRKITLKDLEEQAGLTGNYISRIFRDKTTYSAIEYINCYRIKKAGNLLSGDDLKITDVAAMVGFDDIHYFSRMFRKYEGVSPSQYRKISEAQ